MPAEKVWIPARGRELRGLQQGVISSGCARGYVETTLGCEFFVNIAKIGRVKVV